MLDPKLQQSLIDSGRKFMKSSFNNEHQDFESDQDLKKTQPPLVKLAVKQNLIELPLSFESLELETDTVHVFSSRKSSRVYTQKTISLEQLSFLLWAVQGIREIRGKSYATLRTVPSGGARHGFETYLLVKQVDGLEPGAYHYLPMQHKLEFLGEVGQMEDAISSSLMGQNWAAKASVIFFWSFLPYRCEWRYGIHAHRVALIDLGHVGENLYLACASLNLGTCGIAAYQQEDCDHLFNLDGENEFIVYAQPVGTISFDNRISEKAFYRFVEEQGL